MLTFTVQCKYITHGFVPQDITNLAQAEQALDIMIALPNNCYYNKGMKIEFDPDKNQRNIAERQLSFELAEDFEWETALIWEDKRQDYGETRLSALGYVGMRLYHLTFTLRSDRIRVISLRKANRREVQRYAET